MCKCRHFHDPPSGQDTHSAPPGMNIREGAGPSIVRGKGSTANLRRLPCRFWTKAPVQVLYKGPAARWSAVESRSQLGC